ETVSCRRTPTSHSESRLHDDEHARRGLRHSRRKRGGGMESRRTRQVALVLLLAVGLGAQAPAPAPLPAREVTRLFEETLALYKSMKLEGAIVALEGDRTRILQGFTPEIYKLVNDTRARAVRHALAPDTASPADRAKLIEIADRWD